MPYCIHLILDFISKTAFLGDTTPSDLHQVFIDYFQCMENYIMRRVSIPSPNFLGQMDNSEIDNEQTF